MEASLSLRSYGRTVEAHSHDHHQLVIPLSGVLEMEVAGQGGRIAGECVAWIGSGEPHAFAAAGANRFVVADVPAALAALVGGLRTGPFVQAPPALGRQALRLLRRDCGAQAVRRLLSMLAAGRPEGEALQRVALALRRIEAAPCRSHSSADLAAEVGLRRARFHALFTAATGFTPRAWQAKLRLDLAERLIRHSAMPLAEIALACGYAEQSALTRALVRERGLTPGALRRDCLRYSQAGGSGDDRRRDVRPRIDTDQHG